MAPHRKLAARNPPGATSPGMLPKSGLQKKFHTGGFAFVVVTAPPRCCPTGRNLALLARTAH